jgi:segregation and condensation protein B
MHEGDEDETGTHEPDEGGPPPIDAGSEATEVVDAGSDTALDATSDAASQASSDAACEATEVIAAESEDAVEPLGEAVPAEADERLMGIIESVLFACAEPITLARLAEVVAGPSRAELRAALAALMVRAEQDRRGIRLIEVAGGYQFRTAPEHAEWVRRLFQQRPWRLTRATLETLAIVAYKQPITRAEIEVIRGVDVDSVLASLLARKLVKIVGRKDVIGRPLLYGTTRQFLEVFGLRDLAALPGLSEVAGAMPESVGAGAAGGEETWSGDDRPDEGHTPAEAAGGVGDLLPASSGDDDPERTGDRERQNGHDPGEQGTPD